MKLKVCGMKDAQNIKEAAKLKIEYMGFIFYENSKRFAGEELDEPLLLSIKKIKKVGVFVNADKAYILNKVEKYRLDLIQLHGDESPAFCKDLQVYIPVIKAFGVDEEFNFTSLVAYKPFCNYFLFDTKTKEYGGSGKKFNWELLKKYDNEIPFFISGGIDSDSIQEIKQLKEWNIHAIDINSKFEIKPGLKEIEKIKKII